MNQVENAEQADELTPKQEHLAAELITQPTLAQAAKNAGIPLRTAQRWFSECPQFQARYRQGRRELVEAAVKSATSAACEAVEILRQIARDEKNSPAVRASTASKVVNIAMRGFDSIEVALRLEDVEAGQTRTEALLNHRQSERK